MIGSATASVAGIVTAMVTATAGREDAREDDSDGPNQH